MSVAMAPPPRPGDVWVPLPLGLLDLGGGGSDSDSASLRVGTARRTPMLLSDDPADETSREAGTAGAAWAPKWAVLRLDSSLDRSADMIDVRP